MCPYISNLCSFPVFLSFFLRPKYNLFFQLSGRINVWFGWIRLIHRTRLTRRTRLTQSTRLIHWTRLSRSSRPIHRPWLICCPWLVGSTQLIHSTRLVRSSRLVCSTRLIRSTWLPCNVPELYKPSRDRASQIFYLMVALRSGCHLLVSYMLSFLLNFIDIQWYLYLTVPYS